MFRIVWGLRVRKTGDFCRGESDALTLAPVGNWIVQMGHEPIIFSFCSKPVVAKGHFQLEWGFEHLWVDTKRWGMRDISTALPAGEFNVFSAQHFNFYKAFFEDVSYSIVNVFS